MEYSTIKRKLYMELQEKLNFGKDYEDGEVLELIDEVVLEATESKALSVKDRRLLQMELFDALRRLDILQPFIEDNTVTEIMINGPKTIFVEKNGILESAGVEFESIEKLKDVIQKIVAGCNRVVNEASPIVDARLENGSRVNIVMDPVALNGPIVTIRRFPDHPITMKRLVELNTLSEEAADFLKQLVSAGYNLFISGGTGSGKTTFLNALSAYIPNTQRVITIEDSAELQLQQIPNLVRLETRNRTEDGCREISIRELIRSSLRMRPDRIIIGEVRGAETFDLMQCLNTGHDGSMSTGHANSAEDMLFRLENMVLMGMDIPITAIRQQIAAGLDVMIHLGRLRDGTRKVIKIVEIAAFDEGKIRLNTLYEYESGELLRKGELIHDQKLQAAGVH